MKSGENIFDRKYSSFSTLNTGIVNWDEVLKDVSWFHFSAIAPAVSETAAELCKEALIAAHKKNITVSVDLNYRSLLWKYGKQPRELLPELIRYCDVVMGNIWAANTLLDIPLDESIHKKGTKKDYLEHATETVKYIFEKFPQCKWAANTFRFDGRENQLEYYAALDTSDQQSVSPVFRTNKVIEKVGSGDCFMAGLIYGIASGLKKQEIINFAAAAAFGKLQERGDATQNSVEQVQHILSEA
jgi:2-dehydro-3-deoxygluconokinase